MTTAKIQKQQATFHTLLSQQVGNEFTASQQYVAVAVWFDSEDLPQLARHFYRQALEERNHAMMILQYMMDNDVDVTVPGVSDVRNNFRDAEELVALALEQEREVTGEINELARAAREENDYAGEQFLQWFLAEQVEEVASMSTLLKVIKRADGNMFEVENWLSRESTTDTAGGGPAAPKAAGGAV
jgi:ferritin